MKKLIILITGLITGIIIGIAITILNQKPSTIIWENGEGKTTVSIKFIGQEWNYELKEKGVKSIND